MGEITAEGKRPFAGFQILFFPPFDLGYLLSVFLNFNGEHFAIELKVSTDTNLMPGLSGRDFCP